jgi:nitrogen regulatory protein PII-like uncharacterized protein
MRKIISILLLATFTVFAQKDWELAKEKDGIEVYLRNYKGSKFKELKAVGKINADINTIVAIFKDTENAKVWMADINESKSLEKMNDGSEYKYFLIGIPFPLKNRDMILHERMSQDKKDKTLKITFTSLPDLKPEANGVVRIVDIEGVWMFTPIAKNQLEITYQLYSDPEGVPAWIVNMLMVDGPLKTIKNLKEQVKKEKYTSQKFKFIHE